MRLISLVLALVIIAGLLVFYKDALFGPESNPDQTVQEQTQEVLEETRRATEAMQKQLDEQKKRFDNLEQ